MGRFAQISWPEEYVELQRIEELLRCGICYEYMDTSVMTPCSHNYCSLCIRKYLHYKTQCPNCFEKTFEKDLHTNRTLDELVTHFGKIREKLAKCIAGAKIIAIERNEHIPESPKGTPVRPARTNQILKKITPPTVKNEPPETIESPKVQKTAAPLTAEQKILSSPSTSGFSRMAEFFTPKSQKTVATAVSCKKTVPCPVCGVAIPGWSVNKHLDDCLNREKQPPPVSRAEPKRKPLPKLVFSLMKDVELRKKMRELGLPSQGDRKALESRFHRYATLYNAECDKKEPRSIEELLKQVENDENLEKKMTKNAQAANRLKITRNCDQAVIEEAQKQYREANRQNFDNLIAGMKERNASRKAPVRRSLLTQDGESNEKAKNGTKKSSSNNSDDEECEELNYSMANFEATFQDSDSDACPLQHYRSDDPMSFVTVQMGTWDNAKTPPITPVKLFTRSPKVLDNQRKSSDIEEQRLHVSAVSPTEKLKEVKSEETIEKSIFEVSTDIETSDEDAIPPSPKAAMATKRPKLSLKDTTQNNESISDLNNYNHLKGHKLAKAIVSEFTFDSSSSDTEKSADDKDPSQQSSAEDDKSGKMIKADPSNVDKENHESPDGVNRPVKKRNSAVCPPSIETAAAVTSKSTKVKSSQKEGRVKSENPEESKSVSPPRLDGPVKRRRRGRPPANVVETVDPPRRPLRKRRVNSSSTDRT